MSNDQHLTRGVRRAPAATLVLRQGRGRGLTFTVIGLGFAALLAWTGPGNTPPAIYWILAAVLVGAWLGFGLYMAAPAHYLRLDERGMQIHSLRNSLFYEWHELGPFYAEGTARQPMVTFDLVAGNLRPDAWTGLTHIVTGGREVLPGTYGLSAEALAQTLNARRDAAIAGAISESTS